MKLISKQHDYYDSAMAYGVDDHVFFKRQISELDEEYVKPNTDFERAVVTKLANTRDALLSEKYRRWNERHFFERFSLMYLAFCGKPYPIVIMNTREDGLFDPAHQKYYYSAGDLYQAIDTFSPALADELLSKLHRPALVAFFENKLPINVDTFFDLKTPYFLIKSAKDSFLSDPKVRVSLLPNLGDLMFYKVIDPFSAYQDIEQFLSGVLGDTENNIPQIEDKYMVKAKGFDDKSFRNRGNTKKRKQRKKKL